MINALLKSIVGKKIYEWKSLIESQELLIRYIDMTQHRRFRAQEDDEDLKVNKKIKSTKDNNKDENKKKGRQ